MTNAEDGAILRSAVEVLLRRSPPPSRKGVHNLMTKTAYLVEAYANSIDPEEEDDE